MRLRDVDRGRRDRPKGVILPIRRYLVKLKDLYDPVEVLAEHRGAARHYAKCCAPRDYYEKGSIYREVVSLAEERRGCPVLDGLTAPK